MINRRTRMQKEASHSSRADYVKGDHYLKPNYRPPVVFCECCVNNHKCKIDKLEHYRHPEGCISFLSYHLALR